MQEKTTPSSTVETESQRLFTDAKKCIPGGVNSPVRAFTAVGGCPRFIRRAEGAYLWDVDDNRYLDFVGSWGPMILGHAHPAVLEAISTVARHGTSFGAPCELEVKLAQLIIERMPSIEKIRMVNSGTEATMAAIRLARAYTQKSKIIKFNGCYHGHADSFLVNAGSGALTMGTPSSPGVTHSTSSDTLTAEYNNTESVKKLFEQHQDIAAVIIEPITGNMNMVMPEDGFLQSLREITTQHSAVLIFDEVMTGFRVAPGGAQSIVDVTPDITTLGKVIGGGLPVGAFGGRADIMDLLAPVGPVYQAGTLSGNPLAMAAGLCTLQQLHPEHFDILEERAKALCRGIKEAASACNIKVQYNCAGGMFGLFFTDDNQTITSFSQVKQCDQALFNAFFHHMLNHGYYFAPSSYEAGFISLAHTLNDIESTVNTAALFFKHYQEIKN